MTAWMVRWGPLAVVVLPVLPLLLAQGPSTGKRYALLVGVNQYQHDKLKPLAFAEADVTDLASLLRRASYEVTLLTGSAPARDRLPTKANIERQLRAMLRQCTKGDTALVALAGHG